MRPSASSFIINLFFISTIAYQHNSLHGNLLPKRQSSTNLQSFTGSLGGFTASPITQSSDASRPFEVEGATFPDFEDAGERSCSVQFNSCQEAANTDGSNFTVTDCTDQETQCNDAQSSATVTAFSEEIVTSTAATSSSTSTSTSVVVETTSTSTTEATQTTISTTVAVTSVNTVSTTTSTTVQTSSSAVVVSTTTAATSTADVLPSIPVGFDLVCDGDIISSA